MNRNVQWYATSDRSIVGKFLSAFSMLEVAGRMDKSEALPNILLFDLQPIRGIMRPDNDKFYGLIRCFSAIRAFDRFIISLFSANTAVQDMMIKLRFTGHE